MHGIESALVTLIALLVIAAVAVFWNIQAYLQHPQRRELNDVWFDQFEAFIRRRYRDPELDRRVHALENHFMDCR